MQSWNIDSELVRTGFPWPFKFEQGADIGCARIASSEMTLYTNRDTRTSLADTGKQILEFTNKSKAERGYHDFWTSVRERADNLAEISCEETYGTVLLQDREANDLNLRYQGILFPILDDKFGHLRYKTAGVRAMGTKAYKDYLANVKTQAN